MGCGVGFLKFLLIGLCVLYGVIAIAFSAAGIYLIVQVQKVPDLGDAAKWAPGLLVAIGIFLGVVATFGCAGAVTGNRCLLIIFATSTSAILAAAFIYGLTILVVGTQMTNLMLDVLIEVFNNDQEAAKTWLGAIETAGCGLQTANKMLESSKAIGGCCIALAIVQVFAVIGAYMLMSKSASYERV
ncbi:unnamed protein product [Dibothriocephalus latus]|uniref:Tetraspanin n=1 Tax=Dibothriocephalus latus TaxID=60516 RepID=A0A3P7PB63_DIBLA|nr:unnamed protein product [Dibothriocephalus latus]